MLRQAILFAGQGAQFVGMGRDLAESDPEIMSLYARANDILEYSLSDLCFEGPDTELVKSSNCQPAIFVTALACWSALCRRIGLSPGSDSTAARAGQPCASFDISGFAGLSLGEWTALHAAGAVSFEDALRALNARGRFMQDACEQKDGAMLSVMGLDPELPGAIAEKAGVEVANINSQEQIVLSGERDRIMEAEKLALEAGAKRTVILKVAGAYHSSLMAPAAERLKAVLAEMDFREPRSPVVSNVTGLPHGGAEDIKKNMALQVTSPVQWLSTIRWFGKQGAERYIELGPGRVLSGLVKRIHGQAALCNVQDNASLEKTIEAVC